MLHNEHLRKADENYEIRHNDSGHVIHVYTTDGYAVIYPTLHDLISHQYFGDMEVERVYLDEEDLDKLYDSEFYSYYSLKPIVEKINSTKTSEQQ